MIRALVTLTALLTVAAAQRSRFEICSHENSDCTGATDCGSDFDDGDACASNGIPGVGVRAVCATDEVTLFDIQNCSGESVTQTVAAGECAEFMITGQTYYITNNCTTIGEPSAAPSTSPVASPVPSASVSPAPASDVPSAAPESPTTSPVPVTSAAPSTGPSETPGEETDPTTNPDGDDSPSADPGEEDDDDGSVCFDSLSSVLLADGSHKSLDAVVPGDMVESVDQVGRKVFSEVFLVQHASVTKTVKMVDVVHEAGSLRVTPSHYLRASGAGEQYIPAGKLSIGDKIMVAASNGMVESEVLDIVARRGAPRNIHTMNDRVVVDGVVASCVSANPLLGLDAMHFRMMLTPLKALYRVGLTGAVDWLDMVVYKAYNYAMSN